MTWNHRVMRHVEGDEVFFQIHEVYYGIEEGSNQLSWTENAIAPMGETIEDLRFELVRMLEALDKPVLDYHAEELSE